MLGGHQICSCIKWDKNSTSITKWNGYKLLASSLPVGSLAGKARMIFFLLLSDKYLGGVGQNLLCHLLITPCVLGNALTRYFSAVPLLRGHKWPLTGWLCAVISCVLLISSLLVVTFACLLWQVGMVWLICGAGMLLKSPPFLLLCRTQHSLENQTVTLLKGSVLMPQSGPISPAALLLGKTDLPQSFLILAFWFPWDSTSFPFITLYRKRRCFSFPPQEWFAITRISGKCPNEINSLWAFQSRMAGMYFIE